MKIEQLKSIATSTTKNKKEIDLINNRVDLFFPFISKYMAMFDIIGILRESAFIAQILWESGKLRYTKEIASGNAYDTRTDLGNTPQVDGDGAKYKGRGLIQITGTSNYKAISLAFGEDFINHPELLEQPKNATKSACWWWKNHGLNELADLGKILTITKRINGGITGLTGRTLLYNNALNILKENETN